ncbi:gliding motility-associated C-terminal domain-containing protein [bacterium]|nr:gliding motility-associated C-terminal domain-containing protein [bacterium]
MYKRERIVRGSGILAIAVLLFLGSNIHAQSSRKIMLNPWVGGKLTVENEEVKIAVSNDDGRFTIGTTDGKPLLFGYPTEGATSHTNFFIDGNIYCNIGDPGTHPPEVPLIMSPTEIEGSIICRWQQGSIRITQRLTPTTIGGLSVALIEYTAVNTGTSPHRVGFLLFMDTMINRNDYAPIATQYGYFAVEREFTAPNIPLYWQAFEIDPFQPLDLLIGEGILYGGSAVMPDKLVYGDYWGYSRVEWDYEVSDDPYTDSAILLRWGPEILFPGEVMSVGTYYGKGSIETTPGALSLSLTAPEELMFGGCRYITPNPFIINLFAQSAIMDTIDGVYGILHIPSIFLASDTIAELNPTILVPGGSGYTSWEVGVLGSFPVDTMINFSIDVVIPGIDTFAIFDSIYIPSNNFHAPEIEIAEPVENTPMNCDSFFLSINLLDSDGIALESFLLEAGGREYMVTDLIHYNFSNPALTGYLRTADFPDGELNMSLVVEDIHGCLTIPYSYSVYLDREPPEITEVYPPNWGVVAGSTFIVSATINDDNGVLTDSIAVTINGSMVLTPSSHGVRFEEGVLTIDIDEIPLSFSPVDTVDICISGIMDTVWDCSPNKLLSPYCWNFVVNNDPPSAEVIRPYPSAELSCNDLEALVLLRSSFGINTSTIIVNINGITYSILASEISYRDDTLWIDVPSVLLEEGPVNLSLYAEDIYGIPLPDDLEWDYYLDWTPPSIEPVYPGYGEILTTPWDHIRVDISDEICSVDASSIRMVLTSSFLSETLSVGEEGVYYEDEILSIFPEEVGFSFVGRDTVRLKVRACDSPDWCDPNCSIPSVWRCYTPVRGPVVNRITSSPYRYVSCDTVLLQWIIDDDEEIEPASIVVEIEPSITIPYSDARLRLDGDILTVKIASDCLEEGDLRDARVLSVNDVFRNPMHTSQLIQFSIDQSPPVIGDVYPEPGTFVETTYPEITIEVEDEISGMNPLMSFITVNDDTIGCGIELMYDHGRFLINLERESSSLDLHWGDTVEVCLAAYDNAVECASNKTDYCWIFYIQESGSEVYLISPTSCSSTACDPLEIKIYLLDPEGISEETIVFQFGSELYTIEDPELDYEDNILMFAISKIDGYNDTVTFAITEAYDSMGFSVFLPTIPWSVIVDWKAPEIVELTPEENTFITQSNTPVSILLYDESGLKDENALIWLNGTEFTIESGYFNYIDEHFSFDVFGTGLLTNEENEVCVEIQDSPDSCFNSIFHCWIYLYENTPPVVNLLYPEEGSIISCYEGEIFVQISDYEGVIPESLHVAIGDEQFSYQDGIFEYSNDTLIIDYNTGLVAEGLEEISIWGFCDSMYAMNGPELYSWNFTFDRTVPELKYRYPEENSYISNQLEVIKMLFVDRYSDIDWDEFSLKINDIWFAFNNDNFYFTSDTIVFQLPDWARQQIQSESGEVRICAKVKDTPTVCEPNETTYCWSLITSDDNPNIIIIQPRNNTVTHLRHQSILVKIWDKNGIDTGTLFLSIGDQPMGVASVNLYYNHEDSMLIYAPDQPWMDGEQYHISVVASDNFGNVTGPVEWRFYTDFTGPVAQNPNPCHGCILEAEPDVITLDLVDVVSGVDPFTIKLSVNDRVYDINDNALEWNGYSLEFSLEESNQIFSAIDTVYIELESVYDKSPDYGTANFLDNSPYEWYFFIQHKECWVFPKPFTPNGDGYNDFVTFRFKEILINDVHISIFDLKGRKVRELDIDDQQLGDWVWDGTDERGNCLRSGTYIYSISVDGQIRYNGSIILAR